MPGFGFCFQDHKNRNLDLSAREGNNIHLREKKILRAASVAQGQHLLACTWPGVQFLTPQRKGQGERH